jgi:D-alanyl-D-alanine carboxypeptidase
MKEKLEYTISFIITILLMIYIESNVRNQEFYHNIKNINDPSSIEVLVNKNNKLNESYIPMDLKEIDIRYSNAEKYLRIEAANAFEELSSDATILGYSIIAVSCYRSYNYQQKLYEGYVAEMGLEYADRSSARPGHSEHQTGLAVDVMGSNNDYDSFDKSIEFMWMKNNAHLYGFILRYPSDSEHITGFKYEPWHYRYVGVDIATYIYKNDITLEEYIKEKNR